MKYLLISSISLFILVGCTKNDITITDDALATNDISNSVNATVNCNVSKYSTTNFNGTSYGNGLLKTYYKSGLVRSVRSMITDNHDYADSVIYNFVYYTGANNTLMAKVSCLKKHYNGVLGISNEWNPLPPDESYTITATLDPVKMRLLKIWGSNEPNRIFIMGYSGDRLLKFGLIEIGYDSTGNVTWIPKRPPGGASSSVLYQYNHSKKAAHQFYITSGYSVHEYYNLAEACDWIPVQPVNLRIRQSMFWGNYLAGNLYFDQHVVDAKGYLLSYRNNRANQIIYNTWTCKQ